MSSNTNKINNIIYLFIFISIFLLAYVFYKDFIIDNEAYQNYYFKYYLILFTNIIFWFLVKILSKTSKYILQL